MQSLLAGRYRLRERIGSGGMASVWRARDEVLARQVAVKLIDPELARDAEFRRRFRDEARAAAALSHPHIVTVHDYGESDGTPYIVMELLTGRTLAEAFPVPDVERVVGQIASALAAAHAARIVHRDIKPNNVFLTPAGVKVLDFGIAGDARMGTPDYLPPEPDLSPSGDVYALGVMWFEMVKGRRPEPGETLGGLQERCVARSATARPSAAGLAAALGADLPAADDAVAAEAPTPRRSERSFTRVLTRPPEGWWRAPWPRVAAGGAVAAAVAALALTLTAHDEGPAVPVTAPLAGPNASATPVATPAPTSSAPAPPATHAAVPPSSAGTGTARGRRPPAATPPGAIDALTRMRRAVDEGMAAHQVRPDVAVDFDNLIGNLQGELAAGRPVDLRQRTTELRVKIATRLREGGLTQSRADQLLATLRGL